MGISSWQSQMVNMQAATENLLQKSVLLSAAKISGSVRRVLCEQSTSQFRTLVAKWRSAAVKSRQLELTSQNKYLKQMVQSLSSKLEAEKRKALQQQKQETGVMVQKLSDSWHKTVFSVMRGHYSRVSALEAFSKIVGRWWSESQARTFGSWRVQCTAYHASRIPDRHLKSQLEMRNRVIRMEWMRDKARLEYEIKDQVSRVMKEHEEQSKQLKSRVDQAETETAESKASCEAAAVERDEVADRYQQASAELVTVKQQLETLDHQKEISIAQEATVAALAEVQRQNGVLAETDQSLATDQKASEQLRLLVKQMKGALEAEVNVDQKLDQIATLLQQVA